MPLPENQSPWVPARHRTALDHMAEWSAWYSGDPDTLSDFYQAASRSTARTRPAQLESGVRGKLARWWWGTPSPDGERSAKLHVPLAADICGTSADLLFSEPVKLTTKSQTLSGAFETLKDQGLDAELAEGAEVGAALGSEFLRVVWDSNVSDLPWTDSVDADMALPEFRWGRLSAVTFWQVLPAIGNEGATVVWRLLERHESGVILHGLYRGTTESLGLQVPLQEHPDAEHLAAIVDAEGGVATGTDRLTVTHIPNMRPNRVNRGSSLGRSDLQGVEPLLDALDEAYSSWWRDIRHAKSRIHMPASALDSAGPGQAGVADVDRELYVPMQGVLIDSTRPLADSIHVQQFTIRVAEHSQTCREWTKAIIESAGYSTGSLSDEGGAKTATEVRSEERRSYMTRGKKARYQGAGIREHLMALVEVANANMSAGIRPDDFGVDFADGVQESALSIAQTLQALSVAEAASTETKVKMVHPEWTPEQVAAEVGAILAQSGAPVPVPNDAGF